MDFLPRGSGVVTRRPLELRMVHMSNRTYKIMQLHQSLMEYLNKSTRIKNSMTSMKSGKPSKPKLIKWQAKIKELSIVRSSLPSILISALT